MAMNRPEYRDAKTPRAVTVYTIAQESRHVVFKNVPALSGEETIIQDLLNKCSLYGTVETWRQLDRQQRKQQQQQQSEEPFTLSPILVTFATIDQARWVKRKMDDQVFYANLLQVYYAPEYDTIEDMRIKLNDRRTKVYSRLQHISWYDINDNGTGNKKNSQKRTNKRQQQQQHQRQDVNDYHKQQQLEESAVLIEKPQLQRSTVIQSSKDEFQLESSDDTTATQTTMETSMDGTLPHALHPGKMNPLTTALFIPNSATTKSIHTSKRRRI